MKKLGLLFSLWLGFVSLMPVNSLAAVVEVHLRNFVFDPATVTVNAGDTVRWVVDSGLSHTTTSGTNCTPDGLWNSGFLSPGFTYERVFNEVGTFPYYCITHCSFYGMTGTVVVSQAPPAGKIEFNVTPGCGGVGSPVTIAAESTFRGQFYKFWVNDISYCDDPLHPNWQVLQDWSTNKTAPWTPSQPGIHTVVVWVSDTPDNLPCASAQHGLTGATYEVGATNCIHPVQVRLTPLSHMVNQMVTVTAEAIGSNLQYRFFMSDDDWCDTTTPQQFALLQDWTPNKTFNFTPTAPGIYTLIVWAASDIADPCVGQGGMAYEVFDGAALYTQECAGCHGVLATSDKRGASFTNIQTAIANNTGGMGSLSSLISPEIEAISTALAP